MPVLPSDTMPECTQPPSATRPTGPNAPRYRPSISVVLRRRMRSLLIVANGPEMDETVPQPEVITVVETPPHAESPEVSLLEGSQLKPKSKPEKFGDR